MPLYEYLCESCGRRSEVLQRLDDPPLAACPHCGGPVRKLLSAPAFQFKGSGWYVTDYAKKGGEASRSGASEKGEGAGTADRSKDAKAGDAKASEGKPSADKSTPAPASTGSGDTKS